MSWLEVGLWFIVWLVPALVASFLAGVAMESVFRTHRAARVGFAVAFAWIACFSLAVAMNQ
jgi:hypothetical protein